MMLFWTICRVAFKSLFSHKLRAFLAMLGIVIGIAAVVSIMALGTGAKQQVMEKIGKMGTNLVIVRPARHSFRGVREGFRQNITIEDAGEIIEKADNIVQVSPVVRGSAQVKYFGNNTNTSVYGAASTYLRIRNSEIEKGRNFTETESETLSRAAILGADTAESLFGSDSDPCGRPIKVKGIRFKVIGVLEKKGDQGWFNPDEMVLVPYKTAMNLLFGLDRLHEIDIQAEEGTDIDALKNSIATVLRRRHDLKQDDEDDFRIHSQAEILETASEMTRVFTVLLTSIAGISLLVGGIGIMNIMLVTIIERTREIGIRKAIGARERHILLQFVIESVFLTGIGGIFGVCLGAGIARGIERFSEFTTVTTGFHVLLALMFASGVGIFFGYYPARKAAHLDPIESLRYE